jgi:hypothetical protein
LSGVRNLPEGDRPFQYELPALIFYQLFVKFRAPPKHNYRDLKVPNRGYEMATPILTVQFEDD